jgi:hypothetical protein
MMMQDMNSGQRATLQELHRVSLAEAFGTDDFEMLEIVPVLWTGWECDTHAALVRMPDGGCRLVAVDGVRMPGDGTVRGMLEARLAAYAAAASDTRRLLEIADRAGADD